MGFKDAGATIIAHTRAKEWLVALRDPHTVLLIGAIRAV